MALKTPAKLSLTKKIVRNTAVVAATVLISAAALKKPVRAADLPTAPVVTMTTPMSQAMNPTGSVSSRVADVFRLRLHHLHTGETLDVTYREGDAYDLGAISKLNHFLRDHRTMDNADYDPREFDLLHKLMAKLGKPNGEIDIVCGYRTPQSNNFLRTRSAVTGVAQHSQHMLSKAIDIRVPGVSTIALRNAALSLGMGGVGYYPVSQFVHVDVGPVRQWSFGGAGEGAPAKRHKA